MTWFYHRYHERSEVIQDFGCKAVKRFFTDMYENHIRALVGVIVAIALVFVLSSGGFISFGGIGVVAALFYAIPCTYLAGMKMEKLFE
jgi:hypothetical protein